MSVARVAASALALTVLAQLGCAERPSECSATLAERQKALEAKGTFALTARRAAASAVERAEQAVAEQDRRFAVMRDYDEVKKLCVAAAKAVTDAEAALTRSVANSERITKRDADAKRALASLDGRLALARGLADSGVVDEQATAALRSIVQSGAEATRNLDRARAEQKATGFDLDPAAFDAAADRAIGILDEVHRATIGLAEQIAARCRLKLSGQALSEAALRAHADWILLDVPSEAAHRIIVLRVNRDAKTCAVAYDRAASAAAIENLDGELLTWSVPGTIEHKLLVGFGASSAWFLEGARFSRYPHERSAGFSKACAGAVTCDKPRVGARTIEASCECRPASNVRLLPSDIAKTGRYAWDGARVIAEP